METGQGAKLVCFYLHDQEYAAPISEIKETMTMRPITPVFLTPPWLAGIINLRGDVVAVLDLCLLLGLPPSTADDNSRIIIARHQRDETETVAGLTVDRLGELRTLPLDDLQPVPESVPPQSGQWLRGIATVENGRPVSVLDLNRLFQSEQLGMFSRNSSQAQLR